MTHPARPIAFVLAATQHGSMILNRNDHHQAAAGYWFGVGHQLLSTSSFDATEVSMVLALLDERRRGFGDGVVAIDGGANIGVHSVEWARHMTGWGSVLAFEAQEPIFYALCGNLALNNCFNARARCAALGQAPGTLDIPQANPLVPASFGSLELRPRASHEDIGQAVSYTEGTTPVPMLHIDGLQLPRLDLLKLDIEGMELEVLRGARETLARLQPILLVETLKSDAREIAAFLGERDYALYPAGINAVAVHRDDPSRVAATRVNGNVWVTVGE